MSASEETKKWFETLLPSLKDGCISNVSTKELTGANGNVEDTSIMIGACDLPTHDLKYLFHLAVWERRFEMVQILLWYFVSEGLHDVICAMSSHGTALHWTVKINDLPIARSIVDAYPQLLLIRDTKLGSPFEYALQENNLTFIDYFLNIVSAGQLQPMVKNSFHFVRDTEVATRLHRLDPTLVDNTYRRQTAAESAICNKNGMLAFIVKLRPSQIDFHLLCFAADRADCEAMNYILYVKPDLHGVSEFYFDTVLHIVAAYLETPDSLEHVLAHSSNELTCVNMYGMTPYEVADSHDNVAVMEAYQPYLTIDMIFSKRIHYDSTAKEALEQRITEQCAALDNLLLPELNRIVRCYVGH